MRSAASRRGVGAGRTHVERDRDGDRRRVRAIVEHRTFQGFIIGLIVVNAIMIGLETYPGFHGPVMRTLDQIVLAIFAIEVALRIFAHGW